jgi:NAD(P)-dependent dehydrogenase (short-subunit alcohol dehydrogenase family)
MKNINLQGKVALITGAASGIGAACAAKLAALGATVIGTDVDDVAGEALFATMGGAHCYRHLDVTDPEQWTKVMAAAAAEYGRLDILHLNAGVMSRPLGAPLLDSPLDWFTLGAYRKVRAVNLDGMVYGIIAALGQGGVERIVMTSSGAGVSPLPMDPFYTATKHAIVGLGLSLAPSLAERGIRIDVVCPGAIDTAITAPDIRAVFKQETPAFIANAIAGVLAAPNAPNHVWLAYTEEEGLKPYVPFGASTALDMIEGAPAA